MGIFSDLPPNCEKTSPPTPRRLSAGVDRFKTNSVEGRPCSVADLWDSFLCFLLRRQNHINTDRIDRPTKPQTAPATIGVFGFPDEVGIGVGLKVCDCGDVEEVIVDTLVGLGVGVAVLAAKVEERTGIDADVCRVEA